MDRNNEPCIHAVIIRNRAYMVNCVRVALVLIEWISQTANWGGVAGLDRSLSVRARSQHWTATFSEVD